MAYYDSYLTNLGKQHVITLEHLRSDQQQFECRCGESFVGPERIVKTLIMAHRMEVFPLVRQRLGG